MKSLTKQHLKDLLFLVKSVPLDEPNTVSLVQKYIVLLNEIICQKK